MPSQDDSDEAQERRQKRRVERTQKTTTNRTAMTSTKKKTSTTRNSTLDRKKESSSDSSDSSTSDSSHRKKLSKSKNKKKLDASKKGFLTAAERPKLAKGDVVTGMTMKFEVVVLLGSGGFGDVYKVKPSGGVKVDYEFAAMKTELLDETNNPMMNRLKCELTILRMFKDLTQEKRNHFTDMYDRGITPNFKFIVMELVGKSIYDLQKDQKKREFSMTTALKLGIQTLEAIQTLHDLGYLHRDIKPQNFSIGLGRKESKVYMLDFGIARRYVKKDGSKVLRVPRKNVKFLGTIKYASRACHKSKEQSRKDDLEPWIFMQMEFIDINSVFWNTCRDRMEVLSMKEKLFSGEAPVKKLERIPLEFSRILQYIDDLSFTSAPDYEFINAMIKQAAEGSECNMEDVFDWQDGCKASKKRKTFKRPGKGGIFG